MGGTRVQTYYVDGKFVPADQAVIPVDDLAILRGIGVFDLVRTYTGKILFLKDHIERLFNSARQINLEIPWSKEHIGRLVVETLARNDLEEANMRIIKSNDDVVKSPISPEAGCYALRFIPLSLRRTPSTPQDMGFTTP
jgi:branched-subunit amino acid aminotransferase/4-amino-4-deoxychorismate lyase